MTVARFMIPGRSAGVLARPAAQMARFAIASIVSLLILTFVGIHRYPGSEFVFFVVLGLVGTSVLGAGTLHYVAFYRAANEVRYGYTTLERSYQEVEELDPASGRTIRAAGEPYLDQKTRADRLDSAFDLSAECNGPAVPSDPYRQHRSRWQWVLLGVGLVAGALAFFLRIGAI
ncbi:hypothetical protein B7R22_00725 [Subtercola boreus]|uniref:Uncharacterized protein n=1 Tax=Subtercola boreus TaxID=120213 RepID=A0A3E0W899_9MICO|nr:hypothetical protein [Subtercola boreus]RFA17427.1 hypothetical protein B7R22_00725 [Subtercola boreus]